MTPRPLAARLAEWAVLALAMAAVAHPAHSATQLFKCVIDKRTVYQQQACPVTAEPAPAVASAPPPPAPAPRVASTSASLPARPLKPASRPASAAPAKPR
jgi:hypothetical protein